MRSRRAYLKRDAEHALIAYALVSTHASKINGGIEGKELIVYQPRKPPTQYDRNGKVMWCVANVSKMREHAMAISKAANWRQLSSHAINAGSGRIRVDFISPSDKRRTDGYDREYLVAFISRYCKVRGSGKSHKVYEFKRGHLRA